MVPEGLFEALAIELYQSAMLLVVRIGSGGRKMTRGMRKTSEDVKSIQVANSEVAMLT